MKLTKPQLKQIIKEELEKIMEGSLPQKLGLGFEFTTDELILNLSAMLDSEKPETIPQGPGEFRELEGMITNHIQKKGTPEQKEKLKELRNDLTRAIGRVDRSGMTGYERRAKHRSYHKEKQKERG
tara:strand:+ start:301 stop:678 length:378 start_codon:yes stop_codon:yes gene_type:complete